MSLPYFPDFETWVAKAPTWMRPGDECYDARGRRCRNGGDFMRARDEGAFPVRIFRDGKLIVLQEIPRRRSTPNG